MDLDQIIELFESKQVDLELYALETGLVEIEILVARCKLVLNVIGGFSQMYGSFLKIFFRNTNRL